MRSKSGTPNSKPYFVTTPKIVLAFIPLILTSCVTGRGRVPVDVEDEPHEKVIWRERDEESEETGKRIYPTVKRYGEVVVDTLNIRAGANINYQVIGKLDKGDRVTILDSAFGWHEIELPPGCFGWIHSDYVSFKNMPSSGEKVNGIVTGDSVRIRARPGLKYSVLSQADEGDRVVVVAVEGDWAKIELPEDCTGWVYSDYIKSISD